MQQGEAVLALQTGNGMADGRLCDVQRFGGFSQAPVFDNSI